jgi:hypothetical protein
LRLWDNQLSAAALNSVFTALPTYTGEEYGIIVIDGNPGQGACNKAIAENKGWKVWY